jgi:hypothetical protein
MIISLVSIHGRLSIGSAAAAAAAAAATAAATSAAAVASAAVLVSVSFSSSFPSCAKKKNILEEMGGGDLLRHEGFSSVFFEDTLFCSLNKVIIFFEKKGNIKKGKKTGLFTATVHRGGHHVTPYH